MGCVIEAASSKDQAIGPQRDPRAAPDAPYPGLAETTMVVPMTAPR